MLLAVYLENSYFLSTLRKLRLILLKEKSRLDKIYTGSILNKVIRLFLEATKINFKNSSIVAIANKGFRNYSPILEYSKSVNFILMLYKRSILLIAGYNKTSIVTLYTAGLKKDFGLGSIKNAGIIVITAIFTNIFLSILIRKKIEIFVLTIQFLLLSICLGYIFYIFKGNEIREDSSIIKFIKSCCKIRK